MIPLKHLAEILLLVPLGWGILAFLGWLIRRDAFWIDIGFMALGVGLLSLVLALIIWSLRVCHPRLEPPGSLWRVPLLAMTDIVAAGLCFSITLNLPIWTRITLENLSSQVMTALEVDCLEELHRHEALPPGQSLRIRCIPQREGALSISWFSGAKRHVLQLGYLSPGHGQDLYFRIDQRGELEVP